FVQSLNRNALENGGDAPGIEGMIESYELAFRMQAEMPKLMDVSKETKETQDLYGINGGGNGVPPQLAGFGRACLLARRFAEAGVRFIEVTCGGWDHHQQLKESLDRNCTAVDKPIAALLS